MFFELGNKEIAEAHARLGVTPETDLGGDAALEQAIRALHRTTTAFRPEMRPGPTPALAFFVSPLWLEEEDGRLVQQASLLPVQAVRRYYAAATVQAVAANIPLVAYLVRRAVTHPVEVMVAVTGTLKLWHDREAPRRRTSHVYPAHARPMSIVLADVARRLDAGMTSHEIGALYGVDLKVFFPEARDSQLTGLRSSAIDKATRMSAEEAAWKGGALA
ncbi:MAG: hypothetical protein U0414_06125 [Polyangiaceae bacterium]